MTREKIKSTSKDELEWTTLASDRISLVDAAVDVLDCIQGRYAVATLASVPQDVRLTDAETEAYNAALGFLAREFNKGARQVESHMTRSVAERSEEMQPAPSVEGSAADASQQPK